MSLYFIAQVDPNPKPKTKSKAEKSLLPLPILLHMWQLAKAQPTWEETCMNGIELDE